MMHHPQTNIPLRSNLGVLQIGIKSQDTVLSDSEDSTVTYTTVSSPFGGLSNIGSPRVDGPPVMPEDLYAYVITAFQSPPSPDYVTFTRLCPRAGYVPESDPEEDPKEDDDEDLADYPADGGDDGNDEDESSNDDEDDDVDIEEDEEEEEHPAPADSIVVALPVVDHAPSVEETKPFETNESAATPPPHLAYRVTARMSIRDEPPTPFWYEAEVVRLLAIPSPPPSPLSPWSSPLPQIPSPPLLLSIPPPASPTYLLGYRAAMIRLRAEAPSTSHSPPPHIILSHTRADTPPSGTPPSGTPTLLPKLLPTSSPPLHLLSTDRKVDSSRLPYCLGREFTTRVRQDIDKIYVRLDDEQTERQLMAGRLNMLYRDRHAHARTGLLMEREARMSQEAWGRSMDASDLARSEVMSLHTTVLGQQAVITELQASDRRRQATITELMAVDRKRQAQFIEVLKLLKRLQTQMTENAPKKRTTRLNPETTTTTPATTSVINAQMKAMIDQGVTAALAARDADRNTNGDDSHISGAGVRRTERTAREYLALLCGRMFPKESDKIEKCVGGLPDMIHGSVVTSKPKTMQEAVEIATELMDKKIRTFADRQTKNKRKQDNNQQQQQLQNKRQNTDMAYAVGTGEKKLYGGSKPICPKCNYHHDGLCAPKCHKCNQVGHLARDCRSPANANTVNNQRGNGTGQKPTCYECVPKDILRGNVQN
ncbi:putative reverse transcriptase domain-containing protein [Tanacetum coccineum]